MVSFSMVFSEAVIFALYIFICLTLMKPRFPLVTRVLVYGGVLLCSGAAATAVALAGNAMAALTLLPLIAYLPFSVCVYILSDGGIFETAAACSMGALASLTAKTVKKSELSFTKSLSGTTLDIITSVTIFALSLGIAFFVFRFIRKPFAVCARSNMKNRLLVLIPSVTVFLLLFINLSNSSTRVVLIMTLIIAASVFMIAARLLVYSAKAEEADEIEKKLTENLAMQRKNFEQISRSVDEGRLYRHDMRHHLTTLAGMARQNNSVEILEYIERLNKTADLDSPKIFCKNPAVNAVLSEYMSRSKKINCQTEYKINLPEKLPFELPDVCVIFSNALENSLKACEKDPEDNRYIDLLADFSDGCKLKISVKNPCAETVKIDGEGLPVVEAKTDGHGIGLRGVKKIVETYNGFVCCACENGEFMFCAEIFRVNENDSANSGESKRSRKRSKAMPAVITSIVCAAGVLNFSPVTAKALSDTLSVNVKTLSYGWNENADFDAIYPEFTGDNADTLNQAANDFISYARNTFLDYTLQKYEGYAAEDAGYRIYRNDKKYLSARFYATLNLGGSVEYSRCVTLDKRNGEVIALSDLFDENYDYIGAISAEVIRQMEERNQYNESKPYFLPGGIWSDDECFKEISPDQEFYLTSFGELVIIFEEYTVAAGTEGSPEFMMPAEIFRDDIY